MKKRGKTNNKKYKAEVLGIITTSFGILSLISLFSDKTGIVGAFLKNIYLILAGIGGYIFPTIIIVLGILSLINKLGEDKYLKFMHLFIILFCLLTFLDIKMQNEISFGLKLKQSLFLTQENLTGGLIGAILGTLFYKLFGSIGSYIVLSIIAFITIVFFTELRAKDVLMHFKGRFANKQNMNKKFNNRVKEKKVLLPLSKPDIKENNIAFYDYSDKGSEKKILNTPKETNKKTIGDQYTLPDLDLLDDISAPENANNKKSILNNAKRIEETMNNFNIDVKINQINKGPTVTCYELEPAPGVKVSKILSLSDDLALNLATSDIRIEAPIPGKAAVGIEVPNEIKNSVSLKEMLKSNEYVKLNSRIPLLLGQNISGKPIVSTIDKMPHLLIAGATGSGKSVCINSIIMSILFKSTSDEVKLILIDPKVVELSIYNGIPHLLVPVITKPKEAAAALSWAVTEMERRYKIFAKNNVRDSKSYNRKVKETEEEKLPDLLIIIDELADLMMVAAQEIEDYICRLAQMARAAGIYLIIATQRPSVDVITGTIKANIPSRISFAVSSQIDSRTILDMAGAEKLLQKGDMLFYPSNLPKPIRIQGAFVSDEEVEKVVGYIKEQNVADYDKEVLDSIKKDIEMEDFAEELDELFMDAADLVIQEGQASISLLQRRLRIGYGRAARIIDSLEERNIIGGFEGSKPRKVLITEDDMSELFKERI